MQIVIIEDEKPAARLLERKLNKLGYQVKALLSSVEEAITWFKANPGPELIFLDIQLSDGLSFEIFDAVEINSSIIFTTAYDEYALRAFKLNSIDYLLKPILDQHLKDAIEKYLNQRASIFGFSEQLELFKSFLSEDKKQFKERFVVKIGTQLRIVPVQDVVGFYSEHKATYVMTRDHRDYLLDLSLEQLEECINPACFFRISRKHIVALSQVKDIQVFSNARLKLTLVDSDKTEPWLVSRERVAEFKLWIQ